VMLTVPAGVALRTTLAGLSVEDLAALVPADRAGHPVTAN
jgi:hypothetical protein